MLLAHRPGCNTRLLVPEFDIKNSVRERNRLIDRRTISLLEDDFIRHGFAKRGFLLADSQSPDPGGGVEQERNIGIFPSDEGSVGFVIPLKLNWPLLGYVH